MSIERLSAVDRRTGEKVSSSENRLGPIRPSADIIVTIQVTSSSVFRTVWMVYFVEFYVSFRFPPLGFLRQSSDHKMHSKNDKPAIRIGHDETMHQTSSTIAVVVARSLRARFSSVIRIKSHTHIKMPQVECIRVGIYSVNWKYARSKFGITINTLEKRVFPCPRHLCPRCSFDDSLEHAVACSMHTEFFQLDVMQCKSESTMFILY